MSSQNTPPTVTVIDLSGKGKRAVGCGGCIGIVVTGILLVGTLLAILVGVAAVVMPNLLNRLVTPLTGVETIQSRPVTGNPANYDPIAGYAAMQAFAGEGAQLIAFDAMFVRSDGTLDLTATYVPSPRVSAEFLIEVPAPADAPPVGAGGGGTWYQEIMIDAYRPGQGGRVSQTGPAGRVTYSYVNEGMTRDTRDPETIDNPEFLAPPTCDFARLWSVALERGAPADAVASIEYNAEGYEFRIQDTDVRLEFDTNCRPR